MPHPKHATVDHDIIDLIRERWSPRAFDAARPVSDADLSRLFEAARWAPSSGNAQPWRFIVIDRARHPAQHAGLVQALSRGNQAWAPAAPVLIVVAVALTAGDPGEANPHAWYDTGQAIGFLTLQAQALGLGVRQMAGFDRVAVAQLVGMPDDHAPAVVMAAGYRGTADALSREPHRAAESKPRARRRLNEFVFRGAWGQV